MSVKRKTFDVDTFVAWGNKRLSDSNFQEKDSTEGVNYRKGVMTAIEEVLFSANRYAGYSLIRPDQAEVDNGWGYDDSTKQFNDDTRRYYKAQSI